MQSGYTSADAAFLCLRVKGVIASSIGKRVPIPSIKHPERTMSSASRTG